MLHLFLISCGTRSSFRCSWLHWGPSCGSLAALPPPPCASELGLPLLGSPREELPPHPSVPPEASAEIPAPLEAIRDGREGWKKLAQLRQGGVQRRLVMSQEGKPRKRMQKCSEKGRRQGQPRFPSSSAPLLGVGSWVHFLVKARFRESCGVHKARCAPKGSAGMQSAVHSRGAHPL